MRTSAPYWRRSGASRVEAWLRCRWLWDGVARRYAANYRQRKVQKLFRVEFIRVSHTGSAARAPPTPRQEGHSGTEAPGDHNARDFTCSTLARTPCEANNHRGIKNDLGDSTSSMTVSHYFCHRPYAHEAMGRQIFASLSALSGSFQAIRSLCLPDPLLFFLGFQEFMGLSY